MAMHSFLILALMVSVLKSSSSFRVSGSPVAAGVLVSWMNPAQRALSVTNSEIVRVGRRSLDPIPEDLSSLDVPSTLPDLYLHPNNDVVALEGASNLGAILWAITLYYGIFQPLFQGKSVYFSQPSEWLLYPLAKILGEDEKEWYLDFKEGLQYQPPPIIALGRWLFFGIFGFYSNIAVVQSLGGDSFWGYSIGACLALPASLLSYARKRRPSR